MYIPDNFLVEDFDYVSYSQRNFFNKIVSYFIDRRVRKATRLTPWIKDQVDSRPFKDHPLVKSLKEQKMSNDELVLAALHYVQRDIRYVGDQQLWNSLEVWQPAQLTKDIRKGDCEDGAIYIYCLARELGVPAKNMLIVAGDVDDGKGNNGGHCWLAYMPRNFIGEWVFMDWCYWYDNRRVFTRPKYVIANKIVKIYRGPKNKDNYKNIWFAFNEEKSFTELSVQHT